MTETPEQIKQERDFLWSKCLSLYEVLIMGGLINASVFRQSTQMFSSQFKMNMAPVAQWFDAFAEFVDWVEIAKAEKEKNAG